MEYKLTQQQVELANKHFANIYHIDTILECLSGFEDEIREYGMPLHEMLALNDALYDLEQNASYDVAYEIGFEYPEEDEYQEAFEEFVRETMRDDIGWDTLESVYDKAIDKIQVG